MKKEQENWKEYLENMNKALNEMRVNYQRTVNLKDLEEAKNPLLERRKNHKTGEKNEQVRPDQLNIDFLMPDIYARIKAKQLEVSDGLLITARKDSKTQLILQRMQSMPDLSPLAVCYYSSTLNSPSIENKSNLFK
jgi:hypothetical protein